MTEEIKNAARDVFSAVLFCAAVYLVFMLMFGVLELAHIWSSPILWVALAAGAALWVLDGS